MDNDMEYFKAVISQIDSLLARNASIIVAIDGMCGSGKSTLASYIAENFDCNVFHMDDYYTPIKMKTKDRLREPGGNLHYERFKVEVLDPLIEYKTVYYRPYLPMTDEFKEAIEIKPKKLNIIEGSYSLHPMLQRGYDYKIFLKLDSQVQKERILKRNGKEKLLQFINLWIPLENNYFNQLKIQALCDMILDTTFFW
ncbi:MAG: uridine kinase [Clostridiales bacterium]|jgi:uridine kinase|nr:uridine kinase [Clostridiales bacterium]